MISPQSITTTTPTKLISPPKQTINKQSPVASYQQSKSMLVSSRNALSSKSAPGDQAQPVAPACSSSSSTTWNVKASEGSLNTSNPIREIIESINLAENPNKKVIPLSIGDPTIFGNLTPCKEILDSLRNAEQSGKYYGYQTAAGLEEARQAVANYHFKNAGNRIGSRDVILTSGCSHAIDLCICVLAQAGQNILIPRPGFPLYKTLASVYGISYKQYNLLADSNWSVDLEHLESLIDDQTAAIVINNPSNPCGSVFSRDHLMDILALAERYKKPIIADEIYDKFVFLPEHYKMHGVVPPKSNQKTTTTNNNSINFNNNSNTDTKADTISSTTTKQQLKTTTSSRQSDLKTRKTNTSIKNGGNRVDRQPKSDGFWSGGDDEGEDDEDDEASMSGAEDEILEDERPYNLINWNNKQINGTVVVPNNRTSDDAIVVATHVDEEDYDCGSSESETMSDLTDESYTTANTKTILQAATEHLATSSHDTPFIALSSISKTVPILTCGGISKTCRIPGLRLGWIIVNDPIGAFDHSVRIGLNRLTQRLMGPNSLVQGALREILEKVPESFYTNTMEFIFRNALLCYKRLAQMPGLEPYMPQGSMYLMVRFEPSAFPTIEGDLDFTSKLMNEESVLVLPGKCFEFPNYFRICLTVPTNVMDEALDRMSAFCERHHNPTHGRLMDTNRNSNIKVFR